MTKQQISQELKEQFKKGNLKPSQLKKSRSLNDLPLQVPKPSLTKSKSAEELETISPKETIEQLETKISVLELKLETNQRELSELNTLQAENSHLKESAKTKQQTIEELRKVLEATNQQLALATNELDSSLIARHQGLKDFGSEHSKRVQSEKELEETTDNWAEEWIQHAQIVKQLQKDNMELKREKQTLQKDLNLNQRLAELRKKDPYFEPSFNSSLTYLQYALYALLTVWFLLILKGRKYD